MKDILDSPGLIILQIQDDFGLCNIQDAFAETASIQITDVLCGCHSRSTVATDDLENLLNPFASKRFRVVGVIGVIVSNQFPCLVNENGFLGMTMLSVDAVRNIMSFAAVKRGDAWFCLGNDEILNDTFKDDFGDLQKLLVAVEKHTYDFFVSGDLLDELAAAEATDSAS